MSFFKSQFEIAKAGAYGSDNAMYGTPEENHVVPLGFRARLEEQIRGRIPGNEPQLSSIPPVSLMEPHENSITMLEEQFRQDKGMFPGSFITSMRENVAIVQMDTKVHILGDGIIWIPRVIDCLGLAAISRVDANQDQCRITAMHVTTSSHYGTQRVREILEPHEGATNLHLFYYGMRMTKTHIQDFLDQDYPELVYDFRPVLEHLKDEEFYRSAVRQILPTVEEPIITTTRETSNIPRGRKMTAEYLALSTTMAEDAEYWRIIRKRETNRNPKGLFPTKREAIMRKRHKRRPKKRRR